MKFKVIGLLSLLSSTVLLSSPVLSMKEDLDFSNQKGVPQKLTKENFILVKVAERELVGLNFLENSFLTHIRQDHEKSTHINKSILPKNGTLEEVIRLYPEGLKSISTAIQKTGGAILMMKRPLIIL